MADCENNDLEIEDEEAQDEEHRHEGEKILVIHPGSLHLRFGRASDPIPVTIAHCIAWKCKSKSQSNIVPWLSRPETEHAEAIKMVLTSAAEAQNQLSALFRSKGKHRLTTSADELSQINEDMEADESDVMSQLTWCDISDDPDYIIGDDALYLQSNSGYQMVWPMRYGELNVKQEQGYTVTSLLESLEKLWASAFEAHLSITRDQLQDYKCILLVPDYINRTYIRNMMTLLLDRLGFAAGFVIQESVCASFGAGLSSVCVVDVGDSKTSVCCVEDGVSLEQTRLKLNYGGCDITRTFSWLLDHISFPYLDCQPDTSVVDTLLLQELKHSYCHMDTERTGAEEMHFQVRPPGSKITKYCMLVGDERIVSTLSVFWPQMFGLKGNRLLCSGTCKDSDHTDIFDSDYIHQTRSKQEESARQLAARKKEQAAQNQNDDNLDESQKDIDDDLMDPLEEAVAAPGSSSKSEGLSSEKKTSSEVLKSDQLLGLDEAIIWSIDQCDNDDMKCRMYNCILVVGGGLSFDGTENLLQYRIWLNLPPALKQSANVLVLTKSKDVDPQDLSWKGASILSLLGGTEEHWISKTEWSKYQCKVIREKAPFTW